MATAGIVLLLVVVALAVVAWRARPGTPADERRRRVSAYPGAHHRVLGGHSGLGAGLTGGAVGGGMSCGDAGGGGGGGC